MSTRARSDDAAQQPRDVHRRLDAIRRLFAETIEAKILRLPARTVLVQRQGRRCEVLGDGTIKIEMNFLPTSTCRARSATAPATTGKRSRSTSRARRLPRSLICRSRRPGLLRRRARHRPAPADAERCRAGLRAARPAGADLVGRRGTAGEACPSCRSGRPGAPSTCSTSRQLGLHFEDVRKLLGVLGSSSRATR